MAELQDRTHGISISTLLSHLNTPDLDSESTCSILETVIVQPRGDYEWEVGACLSAQSGASDKLASETLPEQALKSPLPRRPRWLPRPLAMRRFADSFAFPYHRSF